MSGEYRFSFGPWNIHVQTDTFGEMVRSSFELRRFVCNYE